MAISHPRRTRAVDERSGCDENRGGNRGTVMVGVRRSREFGAAFSRGGVCCPDRLPRGLFLPVAVEWQQRGVAGRDG